MTKIKEFYAKLDNLNPIYKIIMISIFIAIIIICSFTLYYGKITNILDTTNIYENIYINGVNVSGLSYDEAEEKLEQEYENQISAQTITITNGDYNYVYSFDEFEVYYDFSEAINYAINYAKSGTIFERYDMVKNLEDEPLYIEAEPVVIYNPDKITEVIETLAPNFYKEPKNATMFRSGGEFVINSEVSGQELNKEDLYLQIENQLITNTSGVITPTINSLTPVITSEMCADSQDLLGTYTTYISSSSSENRVNNIENAAKKVNNIFLLPGETFSNYEAFQPYTVENGYYSAPIIVNGAFEEDMGGGVCQVTTTLYNAVLYAELEIVERTNHSLKVGYVDYGYDATLAGDYIDFKFKNNTEYPVLIECYVSGDQVTCNIYGHETRDPSRTISFRNELIETIPPPPDIVVEDDTLPVGYQTYIKEPTTGYKYDLYKDVYIDGAHVDSILVNHSYYKESAGELVVGTGTEIS